ncbi:NAD(P)/FAD-dependent oxidoreductase [Nocardioides sp. R-C-SC26]|uniref:NAD(P)/FAD-dependent oxidoreductase n=1 Tax=Nocardioides sp. R-C-SC26 TaxID=2870414 RepID=UPI001E373D86|nr:NAD(P)/FAD-dependent oxidoreductase [Nocardioides sp. R-C-SC26]
MSTPPSSPSAPSSTESSSPSPAGSAAAPTPGRHVEVDVLIIGAGPTGLFAAYYAGFRGHRVGVVDSLPELGGQITAMYPEKAIFDVAGFPQVKGRDLVAGLVEQANTAKPTYLLDRTATTLTSDDDGVTVGLDDGTVVRAGAVLITAGIGKFSPRPLPAGDGWQGRGLEFFVPSFQPYAGKDVVIVGGGDSAFDWALHLEPVAASVTLVHRRDAFRAHERTIQQVRDSSVRIITKAEIASLAGDPVLESVDVVVDGETTTLPCQAMVAALGFIADLGPLQQWGLEVHKRHIVVDTAMQTSLPRVFAAGDITEYPGKVRLIAVGFGEAATAVNNATVAIDPSAKVFPGHSSEG